MVRISIPIKDTRTYASITSPLSRMMSMTSASPLGRGRSMYPPVAPCVTAISSSSLSLSFLVGLLSGDRLLRPPQQLGSDVGPVLGQRARDVHLLDPVQVADAPVELLERVLRRLTVALQLVASFVVVVLGH